MRIYDGSVGTVSEFVGTAFDKMSYLADNLGAILALAESNMLFSTRAAFELAWAGMTNRVSGQVFYAEGLLYRCQIGATAIADLPDLVPHEKITPQHFGGVTREHVLAAWGYMQLVSGTGTTAAAASLTALPFEFPAGDYNKAGSPMVLSTLGYGWVVRGQGRLSRILNATIRIQDSACEVKDFSLDEAAKFMHGIEFAPRGSNIRRAVVSNIHVKDHMYGLYSEGDVAWIRFDKVSAEMNVRGHNFEDVTGFNLTECQFTQNDEQGGTVYKGGEYRAIGCRFNNNGKAGLRFDGSVATGRGESVVENYLQGCSLSNNYTGVANAQINNRQSWAITGAANNGAGLTRLTLDVSGGRHTLAEGISDCNVSGTISYNGDHVVTNVTATTVDINVPFLTNQTGSLRRPEWDLEIIGDAAVRATQANDIFIGDCNINFTYIKDAFGVRFDGGRQKVQVFLDGNCYNVSRVANGRGRLEDTTDDGDMDHVSGSWSPVGITGQNYGFVEMLSTVNSNWDDFGGMVWRQPQPLVPMIGNTPGDYFEIRTDETKGISIRGIGSITGDALSGDVSLAQGGLVEIIETGGNTIQKYADGFMRIISPILTADVTAAQSQGFRSAIQTWALPAAFKDATYTVSANIAGNSQSHWVVGRPLDEDTVEFSLFAFASVSGRNVRLVAYGKM